MASPAGARPTWAAIDLAALRANYAEAERRAEGRAVIAVVKADAYGHGALPVARALAASGCRHLAVLTVAEGLALRAAPDLDVPILVLGGVHDAGEAGAAAEAGLVPVVHHAGHLELLGAAARAPRPVAVHVEVDTGMSRMGVPAAEAPELLERAASTPGLSLAGTFTHLARADEPDLAPSLAQLARFREVLGGARRRGVAPGLVHACNSAGLLAGKALADALPEAGAVRPGLMLYGVGPAPHLAAALRPVMSLRTRVAHVRDLAAGDAVGYGAVFRAAAPTRVATLPVGYADGLPVAATQRGSVLIRGRRLPLVGRVSMDYAGVDVGETPVVIGDEAVLFGAPELCVEDAAAAAGTISYELLVRVGARVPRLYRG